jgi:MFS transporter, DHA2 family, methylenomycin A resistance protein
VTAANVVGGRSAAKFGLRIPMFAGLVVAAIGCVLLLGIDDHTTYLAILPGQLLVRLGIGLVVPAITAGTLAAVPSAQSGVASGALNAVRQTGGALGVATFGALMAADMVQGVRVALAISGLILLVMAILSLVGMRGPQAVAEEGLRFLPNSVRPRPAQ